MENIKRIDKLSVEDMAAILLGLACIAQFYICAIVGIYRGYSIQSWAPGCVMFVGLFGLHAISERISSGKRSSRKKGWMSELTRSTFYVFLITCLLQGRYAEDGDALYEQGNYAGAVYLYQKELDSWYLRCSYNYYEDECLLRIAECHCKLGEFDKGRQTYRLAASRYRDHADESIYHISVLDKELKNISELGDKLSSKVDDNKKAELMLDIAEAYKKISCDQKAKECYEMIFQLDIDQDTKGMARKFAEEL